MTRSEASVRIAAPLERVWDVLVDVESWPRWTDSMTSVQRLDDGPPRIGSAARVVQPKLRPAVWTVTELTPLQTFTWAARSPGVTVTGVHTVTAEADGGTRLDLAAIGAGPLARLADLLMGRRVRDYVELEAKGLKAAAEAASAPKA